MLNKEQPIEEPEVIAPNDYLTIKLAKQDYEIFMSAGLLREIVSLVNDPADMLNMFTDQNAQATVLCLVFAPRNERGRVTDEDFDFNQIQLGGQEQRKVMKWIEDHVMSFFIGNASSVRETLMGEKMMKLMQLLNGSPVSVDQKQSAGDTI